jgi:hypothetical protein
LPVNSDDHVLGRFVQERDNYKARLKCVRA